jgi:hypothetical protein
VKQTGKAEMSKGKGNKDQRSTHEGEGDNVDKNTTILNISGP